MKTIKIKVIDYWGKVSKDNFLAFNGIRQVKDEYNFIYEESNPDYLIVGPTGTEHLSRQYHSCVKILIPGELYEPFQHC